MRFRILCLAGLVAVAGIAVAVAYASSKKPVAAASEHDFGNKVVTVQVREAGGLVTMGLKEAKVVRLGDRQFLVGTAMSMGDSNVRGYDRLKVWTPLADVVHIVEHDDVDKAHLAYHDYLRETARK